MSSETSIKPLRIGVIGAGSRGRVSKLVHRPDLECELVCACALEPEVLAEYRQEFGPGFFTTDDYREILAVDDLDAVFICTPDWLHEEHALRAFEAGKGVYLEKPIAIHLESAQRILQKADELQAKLYVGHNMRFMPVMEKMHGIIQSGRIGEVQAIWCRHFICYGGEAYFRDWHSERRYGNGLLLQKASHDIDMIHWFGGGYTQLVVGMGQQSVFHRAERRQSGQKAPPFRLNDWPPLAQKHYSEIIDVEDHNMVMMHLDNGVMASYTQCHYAPDSQRNYTIIGTEGRIENFGDHSTDDHWARVAIWNRRCIYLENGIESIAIPPIEGTHGGADPRIVADFIHFLRGASPQGATPEDAYYSVATAALATESLRDGASPRSLVHWQQARI